MKFFKKIFHRRKTFKPQPKQLRIDGVKTTLTPAPDDAEMAAADLLESLGSEKREVKSEKSPQQGTPQYYKELSEKIRDSRAAEARLTKRYLAYCEEQLALPEPLYNGQIGEMERELYKRQDVAEREGGELLRRWQHCLAECIVRQMTTTTDLKDNTNDER